MLYRILADIVVVLHLAFVMFAVVGGLLALRWSDVDLEVGVIRIRGSLKQTAVGYELGETKTAGSRREVEIGPSTVARLRSHRARQAEEILKLGSAWDNEWGLVFANNIGRPLHQANVLKRGFRPLLDRSVCISRLR